MDAQRKQELKDIARFGDKPTTLPDCCCAWRLDSGVWRQFLICELFHETDGCDHEHHKNEVWS